MKAVRVTTHAVERAGERFGVEGAREDVCKLLERDVAEAVAAGRMSTRLPRFARRYSCPANREVRWTRYVWTADERRVYVIHRQRLADVVVTCIAAVDRVAA